MNCACPGRWHLDGCPEVPRPSIVHPKRLAELVRASAKASLEQLDELPAGQDDFNGLLDAIANNAAQALALELEGV